MNKKGFTLVELLAVIVILAIILAIAVPVISTIIENSRTQAYQSSERMLASAARNYVASNSSLIPSNIDYVSIIKLSDLTSSGYLTGLKDVKDPATSCSGYVLVDRTSITSHEFIPYIKCGTNYTTTNYTDTSLTSVEVLVVAGGGSGGSHYNVFGTGTGAGGGGAGGLIYNSSYTVVAGSPISVNVGAGGIAPNAETGSNGGNSVFGTLTAIGGGGGGSRNAGPNAGGSGGGVGYFSTNGGNGTTGQGYPGGNGGSIYGGAGGGGAGGAGSNASGNSGTNGGNGLYYGNIFGDTFGNNGYFAGGGGGGSGNGGNIGSPGLGGLGGGGNGGSNSDGLPGLINTGSGGGGSCNSGYRGGNGASGIVLVKYPGAQKANGGTVTTTGGYTIHSFSTVVANTFSVLTF